MLCLLTFGLLGSREIVAQNPDTLLLQRLNSLEAGVRAEEGVRAVKRLQHTYSHESGLWNDLADLFVENTVGQFESETVTGKAGPIRGQTPIPHQKSFSSS